MSQNRSRARKTTHSGGESPFTLPPDVSFEKQPVAGGFAYVFRHRTLGTLGRILLQGRGDGQCQLTCEVAGDPNDPMTAKRKAVFEPLGLEISRRMPSNPAMDPTRGTPPPPAAPTEVIESKRLPCPRCGRWAAMLIFAPLATDAGRFEDVARKMYPEYTRLDVPTWIIGPALGEA